jgi:hypothetical protein
MNGEPDLRSKVAILIFDALIDFDNYMEADPVKIRDRAMSELDKLIDWKAAPVTAKADAPADGRAA